MLLQLGLQIPGVGGSHSSEGWLTEPSPQKGAGLMSWQFGEHTSIKGGSHSSEGWLTEPSPQKGTFIQFAEHPNELGG